MNRKRISDVVEGPEPSGKRVSGVTDRRLESGPIPRRRSSASGLNPINDGSGWLGKTLAGRVRLLQYVADGSRGYLFRGERLADRAAVAVKIVVPNPHQLPERFNARFQAEARAATSLNHPHTLRVYFHAAADAQAHFMETEWLSGYDLEAALIAHGPLPEKQALLLASQTCRSLKAAHRQGVVHGDLRPSSLFLNRVGERAVVKVMDYGRQRLAEWNDDGSSQVGLPAGWARYLAPEQIHGDEHDARADVYALGAILYQALSGHLPFRDATGIEILLAQASEKPVPLRQWPAARAVRSEVEDLVMHSIARDPAARFESAGAMLMAIDALRGSN